MLFQLCYASKITATGTQALSDLRDILDEARHFNLQHDIHGVLYFGEGYFIQCLEGQQDIIWALYEKICTDPRHHHTQLLLTQTVQHAGFKHWAMKYVARHSQIQAYFQQLGHSSFVPLQLKPSDLPALIKLLSDIKPMSIPASTA